MTTELFQTWGDAVEFAAMTLPMPSVTAWRKLKALGLDLDAGTLLDPEEGDATVDLIGHALAPPADGMPSAPADHLQDFAELCAWAATRPSSEPGYLRAAYRVWVDHDLTFCAACLALRHFHPQANMDRLDHDDAYREGMIAAAALFIQRSDTVH